MKLHVFNPEHDIALARNDRFFTPPRAGRKLHEDCGFMPALWADDGDYVLVDDAVRAKRSLAVLPVKASDVTFVTPRDLHRLTEDIEVDPWGWNSSLCFRLEKAGLPKDCLPDENTLNDIRRLSSRRFSSLVLRELHEEADIIGESKYVDNIDELESEISCRERSVLKEPWSSSGRGVRYVGRALKVPEANWARNVIKMQGGIMVEPYYNKVYDFAMEFSSETDGVHYSGLSLFKTTNGFYEGNLIMLEEEKEKRISNLISLDKLHSVREKIEEILSKYLKEKYIGPLGVDMMLIEKVPNHGSSSLNGSRLSSGPFLLHPMVEINLRRTMGHVAVRLAERLGGGHYFMQINYEGGTYSLSIAPMPAD